MLFDSVTSNGEGSRGHMIKGKVLSFTNFLLVQSMLARTAGRKANNNGVLGIVGRFLCANKRFDLSVFLGSL